MIPRIFCSMSEFTLDGKSYDIDQMSDEARAHLISINFADAELRKINAQRAIFETAKSVYAKALKDILEDSKYKM